MTEMSSQDDRLERFFAAFSEAADTTFVPRRARARAAFLMEISQKQSRRAARRWRPAVLVFAACATAIVAWILRPQRLLEPSPRTSAPAVAVADVPLTTPPGVSMPLRVDDDARVVVGPSSQVRFAGGSPGRRRLVLEHGTASVSSEASEWIVHVGDYEVRVSGTCTIEWKPEVQSLVIESRHGRAELVGSDIVPSHVVPSGERFEWSRDTATSPGRVRKPDDVPKSRAKRAGAERVSARKGSRALAAPAAEQGVEAPTWRALAARGDFRAAFAEAERLGMAQLCETLPSDALLDLADVARYSGAREATTKALRAIRSRFPGTDAAARAAFDMGRLHARDCEQARLWFGTYLSERPAGAMAAAARRRLAECEPDTQVDPARR